MKVKVTPKNCESRVYPLAALEDICLVYAGGGNTQAQGDVIHAERARKRQRKNPHRINRIN